MNKKEERAVTNDSTNRRKLLSANEARNILLGILADFLQDENTGNLDRYLRHFGFDLLAVRDATSLPDAWAAHYRIRQGIYDVDRACADLASWPPIAARIAELRAEKDGGKAVDL